jgi:hypothetical protein
MKSFYPTLSQASCAILLGLFVVLPPRLAHGDDLTGQAQDDPKDLLPAPVSPPRPQTADLGAFQPLPHWARGVTMPALPEQLKPMGKKIAVLTTPPSPAPAPLAPPPETPPASGGTPAKATNTPAPADNSPVLVTVSPFLQWIKSNPQAAAVEARQEANTYHASSSPESGPSGTTGATGAPGPTENPYWLPPLIDSSDFGPRPVTGSAAIYSTPQR